MINFLPAKANSWDLCFGREFALGGFVQAAERKANTPPCIETPNIWSNIPGNREIAANICYFLLKLAKRQCIMKP